MTFYERYEGLVNTAAGTLFSTMLATGIWLIRRILTNQGQIEALKSDIAARDARREEEVRRLDTMLEDIRELRTDMKSILARGYAGN